MDNIVNLPRIFIAFKLATLVAKTILNYTDTVHNLKPLDNIYEINNLHSNCNDYNYSTLGNINGGDFSLVTNKKLRRILSKETVTGQTNL